MGAINAYVVFVAEHCDSEIDRLERFWIRAHLHVGLVYFTLQRASRSFRRTFADLSFQRSKMRPSLIAAISYSVLRWFAAGTRLAFMICPLIAR